MPRSRYPHIEWVDLTNDGTLVEVAVMRRDGLGNMYFVRLDALDEIDKRRLFKIVTNRNAELYELWDLMSNVTLGNGVNALEYFHQLVKSLLLDPIATRVNFWAIYKSSLKQFEDISIPNSSGGHSESFSAAISIASSHVISTLVPLKDLYGFPSRL